MSKPTTKGVKRKRPEDKRAARQAALWRIQAGLLVVGVLVAVAAWWLGSPASVPVRVLGIDDTEEMRRVFLEGDPAVVQCTNATVGLSPFTQNVANQLHAISNISVHLFRCHERMPSGKTWFERFNVKPVALHPDVPLLFLFANGQAPKHLALTSSSTPKKLAEGVVQRSQPRVKAVDSFDAFEKTCVRPAQGCLLMVTNPDKKPQLKIEPKAFPWLSDLMLAHRTVRFAALDSSKFQVELDSLRDPPSQNIEVMAMRRRGSDGEFDVAVHEGEFGPSVSSFLSSFLHHPSTDPGSDPTGLTVTTLTHKPHIRAAGMRSQAARAKGKGKGGKGGKGDSHAKPEQQPPVAKGEEEAEHKRGEAEAQGGGEEEGVDKEQLRRQQMEEEREKAANWVWEVTPEEDEGVEDEEEIVLL